MKKIFLIIISAVLLFDSCRKPEVLYCNPIYKTTGMKSSVYKNEDTINYDEGKIWLNENDTCSYNILFYGIYFDAKIINNQCPDGKWSFVNTIKEISITLNNNYNSDYNANDTINDILYLKNNDISLNDFILSAPTCSFGRIDIKLIEPPDSLRLNSFNIKYMESDSTIYEITTMPIYILP